MTDWNRTFNFTRESRLHKDSASQDQDNLPDKILVVSHKEKQCGVHEYGLNMAKALKKSTKYSFIYAECSNCGEFLDRVKEVRPSAIIYNYHPSTLAWVNQKILKSINLPHIGLIHEVTQQVADAANNSLFHYHIGLDPTLKMKNPIVFKSGRIVLPYTNNHKSPETPTIGSFGFGLKGKGFEKVITTVQKEYDRAIIRLHIPFATFGDADGSLAIALAQRCQRLIVKPGIKLSLSHDFLSQEQLLDFLAQNTVNAFFYDRLEDRGISSVIDHALAVKRPIAVTKSHMFRHIISAQPSICIEDSSLRQIINNGIAPLEPFYNEWTEANFILDYEQIFDRVLGKEQIKIATLSLFETPIGYYYLPTDVQEDLIVNEMKAGRVFEPEIVETAKEYMTEGSIILDVGANFGQMTLLFSELVGEKGLVISFEADSFTFSVLEKNIAANRRTNIIPICKAVYDKTGEVMFYRLPDFKRFSSYGSYGLDPNAKHGIKVETMAIDSLKIQDSISFMKVDVQGSDLFVLRGAVETIRKHQMPIIFEYEEQFQAEFKTSWSDYLQFIESIDYKIEKVINSINYLIVPKRKQEFMVGLPNVTSFNRILDDAARSQYQSVISQLFTLAPEMMARKIPEANIQQAFILDTVQKFASHFSQPQILCVGSYEDSAAASLKKLGYELEEIDPVINCDLNAYFHKPSTIKGSYDIIFSTSVLEHVQDDELFMTQIAELLAPGGTAILTCDYNDRYQPGDRIPVVDHRLYTQKDLKQRLLPLLKNCVLVDNPKWDCLNPDFTYEGCRYTFATFVFKKLNPEAESAVGNSNMTLNIPQNSEITSLSQQMIGRIPNADKIFHWNMPSETQIESGQHKAELFHQDRADLEQYKELEYQTQAKVEIISVDVPTTLGTTFSQILSDAYGNEAVFMDNENDPDSQIKPSDFPPNIKAIHGHFHLDKYKGYFSDAKRVIWLRNPIIRLISNYFFWRAQEVGVPRNMDVMGIVEFAELPAVQNIVANYIGNNQLSDFHFVGIQEFFGSDLEDLKMMMKWSELSFPISTPSILSENKEQFRKILDDSQILKKLAQSNSLDMELYQEALNLRAKRRNELGGFHQLLELSEQSQSQLHQTRSQLEQFQSQLHQTQSQLEQSQSQLHQTQSQLEQSQSQLHQTQSQLEQSQSQLHQTQSQLEQSQSQLHQTQSQLEQFQSELLQTQSQLHQTQSELEQSQSQLLQTQDELEQSQSQLLQTQDELEQSQSQLLQTQDELKQSQLQLHQTQDELLQTQSQLHQTQSELEQSQSQLHQTQSELEQSQSQLHQTRRDLKRSQSQLHLSLEDLQQSHSQLHQTQEDLQQSHSQLHQTQEDLQQSHSQLHQLKGEFEQLSSQFDRMEAMWQQSQSQLHQLKEEFDRSRLTQATPNPTGEQSQQTQYKLLVWEAWYACQNLDLKRMTQYLQKSLKHTPFSRTETILNWLDNFVIFSSEKGEDFDTNFLTNTLEWKELIRGMLAVKTTSTNH